MLTASNSTSSKERAECFLEVRREFSMVPVLLSGADSCTQNQRFRCMCETLAICAYEALWDKCGRYCVGVYF